MAQIKHYDMPLTVTPCENLRSEVLTSTRHGNVHTFKTKLCFIAPGATEKDLEILKTIKISLYGLLLL